MSARPLGPGEPVLLIDRRRRRYMIQLRPGGVSDLRGGKVAHVALLGQEEGRTVLSSRGERLLVVRPTLAEFVLEMPRGAQIVYPKDLGAILIGADVFPGARVLEAGIGSGALTMALLRAVGPGGRVVSYEIREEFARIAEQNIRRFLGAADTLVLRRQDVYAGIVPEDTPLDRIVLDVPEPWRVAPHAARALAPGGIWLSYVPTVPQIVETVEILMRPWNIEGLSVRPAHRMVAHTGFLTTARRIQNGGAEHVPNESAEEEPADPEDP
ncbi:MAG TPA: tRNA (adenine-N1)-methyltransferase [bacterium]|nr:tRNA (adenine-N1)-methyltransferase [bacterium]